MVVFLHAIVVLTQLRCCCSFAVVLVQVLRVSKHSMLPLWHCSRAVVQNNSSCYHAVDCRNQAAADYVLYCSKSEYKQGAPTGVAVLPAVQCSSVI